MAQETSPIKVQTKQVNNHSFRFESEVVEGKLLDTKVFLNDQLFFYMCGEDIEKFITDFTELDSKYRI